MDLKLMFSYFMTGENTDCHSKKVKAAPIYKMEVYQKTPPKVKYTDITQKSPNWSQQLEIIESPQKNPAKSKKNIKTFEQTLQYLKMGLPICQIKAYQEASPKVKHTSITQQSPIWSR